jgi:hypothetical protein
MKEAVLFCFPFFEERFVADGFNILSEEELG